MEGNGMERSQYGREQKRIVWNEMKMNGGKWNGKELVWQGIKENSMEGKVMEGNGMKMNGMVGSGQEQGKVKKNGTRSSRIKNTRQEQKGGNMLGKAA